MKTLIKNFLQEEEGATMIEYGLIAGLVAIAAIAGLTTLGTDLKNQFNSIAAKLGTAS